MLADTRFAPFFEVVGERRVHYGEYPCGPTLAAAEYAAKDATASAGSCC